MRTISVLVWLAVACGPSARPAVVDNVVPTAPPRPDPHATRDGLVNEVFAMLSSGNTDGLVALAPKAADMEGALSCDDSAKLKDMMAMVVNESHNKLRKTAQSSKALYEVVAIDTRKTKPEGKAGDREQDCTLKVDVTTHRLEVKLKTQKDGKAKARVEVLQLGARFYLSTLSRVSHGDDEMVGKFRAHVERVCACKDATCIADQSQIWVRDAETWAKEHAGEAQEPDPDTMKATEELAKQLAECTVRLSTPVNTP